MTNFDENKSPRNLWKKFYNPRKRRSIKIRITFSTEKKKERTIEIKKSEGVDMIKLYNSIDRVKKFLSRSIKFKINKRRKNRKNIV